MNKKNPKSEKMNKKISKSEKKVSENEEMNLHWMNDVIQQLG